MNLVNYLKDIYGYDVPIFLKDIRIGGMGKEAIRQALSRAVKRGEIERYKNGIYYFSHYVEILDKKSSLNYDLIIGRYFISDDYGLCKPGSEVYGYYTGYTFLNWIGLSTQVPARHEITTNKAKRNSYFSKVGLGTWLYKPTITITRDNYRALQFFEMFNWVAEWEYKENKQDVMKYFKKFLTMDDLKYSVYFKGKCIEQFKKDITSEQNKDIS